MKKIISVIKKAACAVIIAAVLSSTCMATFSASDAGTSTAQFLKLGAGAREESMGGAAAGMADDSTSIYWNPAGLNNIESKSLSVMHASWFQGIYYDWASYAQRVGKLGVFGIGVQYLSYGSITQTDTTGLETGSFSPTDMCAALSYAYDVEGYGIGVNIKYISSTIQNTASAYAMDAGVQRKLADDNLVLGLAVQNAGTGMKFINETDSLPMNIKFGGAYWIKQNWAVALDANAPVDNQFYLCAGTEYSFKLGSKMAAAVRAGYNTEAQDTGGLNSVSAGLGLKYFDYSVDYAFVPYGDLGNTSRISLTIKFGKNSEYDEKKQTIVKNDPQKEQKKTLGNIAVAEFAGKNVSQSDASIVADFLRTELVDTNKCSVIDKANMDKILAESSFQQTGCTSSECMVQIGKILNVKYMITGSLSKIAGIYYVMANVVDVETGRIIASYKQAAGEAKDIDAVCKNIAQIIVE